jgi:putative ABC transport system substrate-binding protein
VVLLAVSIGAGAQGQGPVRRIGFLGMDSNMQSHRFAAFREGMRKQGFVEGENLVIETRWAEGSFDRLPALAAELVARKVEVIVSAAPPAVRALQQATSTIPIVMTVHDPIGMGFAVSLPHPGGNITGIAFQDMELSAKRLDLFRSLVPNLTRAAIIWNRAGGGEETVKAVEYAASTAGLETKAFEIREATDIPRAVDSAKAWGAQGVVQLASPVLTFNRKILLDSLAAARLPATCEMRDYVQDGCLMSYSADLDAMFAAMAGFTARILRGAKPSETPIEQPQEFVFVVNLTTAKSLGLTVSPIVQMQITETVR